LLREVDNQVGLVRLSAGARGLDTFHERAIRLLTQPAVRRAFDLSLEPESLRQRYGRNTFGQSCLLAHRLVARRFLYVAAPGIRDDLQFGGAGILVLDMDLGFAFVKRIETPASRKPKPDNMKGICASATTGRLYFSTPKKLYCPI
jgi:hypothetical protein